jgi:hypothetical protein
MSEHRKHTSSTKVKKIVCRVESCKRKMTEQSYREHLIRIHPEEDSNDRRPYGVKTMTEMLALMSGGRVRNPGASRAPGPGAGSSRVEVEGDGDSGPAGLQEVAQVDVVVASEDMVVSEEVNLEEASLESMELESANEEVEVEGQQDGSGSLGNLPCSLKKEIEELAKKIGDVDVSNCKDEFEAASKRVKAANNFVDVGREIRLLDSVAQSLKDSLGVKEEREKEDVDTDSILKNAKSMKEITEKVCQFEYDEFKDGGKVNCIACEQSFKYSRSMTLDFTTEKTMSNQFSNLKIILRKHLKTAKHLKSVEDTEKKELLETKEHSRNLAVGIRNGKLVYYLVKLGRPDTDYPLLVLINTANGADMGDINHSAYFVTKFIPSLAGAVRKRWRDMLASPMVATGCR